MEHAEHMEQLIYFSSKIRIMFHVKQLHNIIYTIKNTQFFYIIYYKKKS